MNFLFFSFFFFLHYCYGTIQMALNDGTKMIILSYWI